jgi:hypothetical protein
LDFSTALSCDHYYQINAPEDAISNRSDSFSTRSSGCCGAQTRTRHSQQWNSLLPGATAWLDSPGDCVGPCEKYQADKVGATLFLICIIMIIDSSQVPVDAVSNCSTQHCDITRPPAARVNALWTQCGEATVRMAGRYPVFRYSCSAARSHQGDGNPRFRFGFFI